MVDRKLFIEGTKDTSNGDLRGGFGMLLEKKLKGKMPRLNMGDGKEQTIKKFKNSTNSKILCDLDAPATEIENDLIKNEITEQRDDVFYMIQEMESWFLSQPDILESFYNTKLKITKKHGSEFSHPDEELQEITKGTKKGIYHKVNHGAQLLKLLDADRLYADFSEFKRLIDSFK
jgi:hypothetical protein